jgi:hypothetical protein
MRRDVFIQNDSGGFSIVAADAIDAIIDDARTDDLRFVRTFKALLLELYGDDSRPVRVVIDEPLRPEEEAQWLAKASWRIDTSDGRLLVMGGFDPDVISWWKEESGGGGDGPSVALVQAKPGTLRVDVYAHTGSMNGRQILSESDQPPGAVFRRSHPGRAFPLWLARMLEFSGEEDPGHEDLWRDVRASMEAGRLDVDTDGSAAIGFLVHFTRTSHIPGDPPEGGWFARDTNRRVPKTFPLGLPSDVPDPEIESFRDRLLGRNAPAAEPAVATLVEIIEVWSGDPLRKIQGEPPIVLPATDAFLLYWIAGLAADSPPRFELWVTPQGTWTPPASCAELAVALKGSSVVAIGPSSDAEVWTLWWSARAAAQSLAGIPDGSTIDFAMAPRLEANPDANPAVGRALYSGTVVSGGWQIAEASPEVTRESLENALTFVRDLVTKRRLQVRRVDRPAFEQAVETYVMEVESVIQDGDTIHLAEDDERTLLLLASAVFRVRFSGAWPVDIQEV